MLHYLELTFLLGLVIGASPFVKIITYQDLQKWA